MTEQRTLAQKLLSVQKNIGALTKSANNPFFKSKYADLNQVLEVAKEALHPEGLFVVQGPGMNESGRYIETTIIDGDSGQSISCKVPFSGSEKNMQEIGAATTYGRRFGLVSLLALEQEDDDYEEGMGRGKDRTSPSARPYSGSPILTIGSGQGGAGKTIPPKVGEPAKPPVGKAVSEGPTSERTSDGSVGPQVGGHQQVRAASREMINKKISLTSKVLLDSKRATQDEVMALLQAFVVEEPGKPTWHAQKKEDLTDKQAAVLLNHLEGILNK